MKRNLTVFFIGLTVVSLTSWALNRSLAPVQQKDSLKAEAGSFIKPLFKENGRNLNIEAESALSVFLNRYGVKKTLFEKNGGEILPIASLTKLMTAEVAADSHILSGQVEISKNAASRPESPETRLQEGEAFLAKDLFIAMLVESNNIAAFALAEKMGEEKFVELMNEKAEIMGLEDTEFFNPDGLDGTENCNSSSARDLAELSRQIFLESPFIWKTTALPYYDLYTAQGRSHHKSLNTNKLLEKVPGLIGAKTGVTPKAGECLIVITEAPNDRGQIISVILNSQDRFREMEKLIDWTESSYSW